MNTKPHQAPLSAGKAHHLRPGIDHQADVLIPTAHPKRVQTFAKQLGKQSAVSTAIGGATNVPNVALTIVVEQEAPLQPVIALRAASTREEWLQRSIALLDENVFDPANHPLPHVDVTVGFPSKKGAAKIMRSLGQCWPSERSANGHNQIFLSPALGSAEEFLGVLSHELVHAVDDCKSGHSGAFVKISKAIGLTDGKPTCAKPGPELKAQIERICAELGSFPHATLKVSSTDKPQGTRLLKITCPSCGYTCRTTSKWIGFGLPTCPCQTPMQPELLIN